MKTRSFTQQYGYIAVLFALSFVCALPLLFAHSVQDHWNDERETSGWAWVGHPSHSVQNGNLKTRSEHQCGILNETGKKIGVQVEYKHYVSRNGGEWDDDTYWAASLQVQDGQYFTTSDVPGNYVRSTSNPTAPGKFELRAYTMIHYSGKAGATAKHQPKYTWEQ